MKPYSRGINAKVDDLGDNKQKSTTTQFEGGAADDAKAMNIKRTLYVKKTQIDPTAVLSYSLGVSVVHLALIVAITQVKGVDLHDVGNMSYAC